MKKTTCTRMFTLTLLAIVLVGFGSCKKDKKSRSENFLNSYLEQSGFNQKSTDAGGFASEFGLFFTPLKPGAIKKIHVKIPGVQNSLRVTVWEVAANKVLFSQVMNVSTANATTSLDVAALSLQQNVEYAISINSIPFYRRTRNDAGNAAYPFTCGNIKVLNYKWANGTTQSLPANIALNYYGGDMSFDFLPND